MVGIVEEKLIVVSAWSVQEEVSDGQGRDCCPRWKSQGNSTAGRCS